MEINRRGEKWKEAQKLNKNKEDQENVMSIYGSVIAEYNEKKAHEAIKEMESDESITESMVFGATVLLEKLRDKGVFSE